MKPMQPNVKTEREAEKINDLRNDKIYKELLEKETSVLFDDPLENDIVLNMGPQHPATHGVLRCVLRLDGETVLKCVPELGYLHRGYEKMAENTTFYEYLPHTDRLDYLSPFSNNVAFSYAVENSLGIEAPPRAQWIRVLVAELARISSHLMAMGSTCMDAGALTILLWTFTEREKLYDIFELICGARFTTSYTRIGGVANDIPKKVFAKIKEWADQFPGELEYFEKLVHRNRIFVDRLAGNCIVEPDKAIKLGLTGPTLRGSGIPRDLRRDEPYLIYDRLDFDVITYDDCDVYSRYMVRVKEMYESLKIVYQILDKIPEGDIRLKDPETTLPKKSEVYTKMEDRKSVV